MWTRTRRLNLRLQPTAAGGTTSAAAAEAARLGGTSTLVMTENPDTRYRRLLAKQLAMNEETWRTPQSHGVTEATELRLDFFYVAPDRPSAESLKQILNDETDTM